MIACKHWTKSGEFFRGQCSKGIEGGRPSYGHCVHNCGLCTTTNAELAEYMQTLSEGPSFKTKATSLLKHTGQVIAGIPQGKAFASKLEQARRFGICKSNTCNKYDNEKNKCNKCGCSLKLKIKAEAVGCHYWEIKENASK